MTRSLFDRGREARALQMQLPPASGAEAFVGGGRQEGMREADDVVTWFEDSDRDRMIEGIRVREGAGWRGTEDGGKLDRRSRGGLDIGKPLAHEVAKAGGKAAPDARLRELQRKERVAAREFVDPQDLATRHRAVDTVAKDPTDRTQGQWTEWDLRDSMAERGSDAQRIDVTFPL